MRSQVHKCWKSFSASITGPTHLKHGLPNQDFSLIRWFKNAVVAVVSDGLGSHEFAHIGSMNACTAVANAAKEWLKKTDREPYDLLRLIQTYWLMKLRPIPPNKAGATCLFAIVESSYRVTAGRLGDGMILTDNLQKGVTVMEEVKDGFANQTVALSEGGILRHWELNSFYLEAPGGCICLMTDGISEDLERDKLEIVPAIFRQLSEKSPRAAKRHLKKELHSWATPYHTDDKTVAALLRV